MYRHLTHNPTQAFTPYCPASFAPHPPTPPGPSAGGPKPPAAMALETRAPSPPPGAPLGLQGRGME